MNTEQAPGVMRAGIMPIPDDQSRPESTRDQGGQLRIDAMTNSARPLGATGLFYFLR
jgi:hypothetical protein